MNNKIKWLFSLLSAAIFLLGTGMVSMATEGIPGAEAETGTEGQAEVPGGVNRAACILTFGLKDNTNDNFLEDVDITIFNQDTHREYNYRITSAEYLYEITVIGKIEQGSTYNIALSFPSKGEYLIQNEDGSPVAAFFADSDTKVFDWVVVSTAQPEASAETLAEPVQADLGEAENADELAVSTENEEADVLFNNYVRLLSRIEYDSDLEIVLDYYEDMASTFGTRYEEQLDKPKEEFMEYPLIEQILWYDLYVSPLMHINFQNYEYYLADIGKWRSRVADNTYSLLARYDQQLADAYMEIMEWQYQHFIDHGSVYNFFTGKTSLEETSMLGATIAATEATKEEEMLEELRAELLEELKEEEAEEKGIWGSTIDKLKNNMFTIIILFILVGAVVGVTIYRKRKAIDDEEM